MDYSILIPAEWGEAIQGMCPRAELVFPFSGDTWVCDREFAVQIGLEMASRGSPGSTPNNATSFMGYSFLMSNGMPKLFVDEVSNAEYKQTTGYNDFAVNNQEYDEETIGDICFSACESFGIDVGEIVCAEAPDTGDAVETVEDAGDHMVLLVAALGDGFRVSDGFLYSKEIPGGVKPWMSSLAFKLVASNDLIPVFSWYGSNGGAINTRGVPCKTVVIRGFDSGFSKANAVCFGKTIGVPRHHLESRSSRRNIGDPVSGAMVGYAFGTDMVVLANIEDADKHLLGVTDILAVQFGEYDKDELFDIVDRRFYEANENSKAALGKVYDKYYGKRFIHTMEAKRDNLISDIEAMMTALQNRKAELAEVREQLEVISGAESQYDWKSITSDFDRLAGCGIIKVVFCDTGVMAFTNDVRVKSDKYTYGLGRFIISFPYSITSSQSVCITNVTRTVDGIGQHDAAHVFSGRKSICWGNCETDVFDAIRRHDIVDLIYVCRAFLDNANTMDSAGKHVKSFPDFEPGEQASDISYTPPRLTTIVHLGKASLVSRPDK